MLSSFHKVYIEQSHYTKRHYINVDDYLLFIPLILTSGQYLCFHLNSALQNLLYYVCSRLIWPNFPLYSRPDFPNSLSLSTAVHSLQITRQTTDQANVAIQTNEFLPARPSHESTNSSKDVVTGVAHNKPLRKMVKN